MSHESDFLADLYQKYDAINLVNKPETYYNRLQREGVTEEKEKMQVTKADKDLNTPAWKRYKAGDPRYEYKGTDEGKMSDLDLDMKELSDAEFMKKHGKSKQEMKDSLGEDGHTDVDSMQRKAVVMIKDLMALHTKFKEMDGTGNLDTWLTNKLAVAQSDVEAVKNYLTNDVDDSNEDEMTKSEVDKKEKIVKGMKKDKAGFRKRYGKDADAVMYATATKLAMKDDKSQIGESTMSDKKKLNEGISITTDTLEDSIALMTILKNAGLDPSQMNIQGQQPSMPEPEAPMAPMGQEPEGPMDAEPQGDIEGPVDAEPETEMYANDKDEAYLDKDDFELKRNKVPNSKMGPSSASTGDNPLPEGEELEEKKKDHDGDGDIDSDDYLAAKDKAIKKAMGKDKDKKEESTASDTDKMIEELNKQYELMLVGGAQDALGLTASARIIADESLYDGAKFVIAEIVAKPEGGLVAEDGAWEGDKTNYTVAYLVKEGKVVGQIGAGNVPYLSRDGNGTYPVNHKLNVLDLSGKNFFEDNVLAVDSIKAMYEDLGEEMFGEVTTEFGGCEMLRNE